MWIRRRRFAKGQSPVARIYTVHLKDTERYFMRLLLCHVRGAICHADIRTVENVVYHTYRDACLERNLLADDKEWHNCLSENAYQSPREMRLLIIHIFLECNPSDPKALFDAFADELSNDFNKDYKASRHTEADLLQLQINTRFLALNAIDMQMQDVGAVLDASLMTPEYINWLKTRKVSDRREIANRLVNLE